MRVLLLGPLGAGKGTQARLLQDALGVPQIATGDMLREAQHTGSPLGQVARRSMEAGQLVPDDVVIGLLEERLGVADCATGFILDGFPRTVPPARALQQLLVGRGSGLEFYRTAGLLRPVAGTGGRDDVFERIRASPA